MTNERLEELLSGLLDEILGDEETAEIEAELESSAEARALLILLRCDRDALRGLPSFPVPRALREKTLLKARYTTPSAPGRTWQRALFAAASMFLVVGIFWTMRPMRTLLGSRLFLSPGAVADRAAQASQELRLAATGADSSHLMVSQELSGRYTGGHASVNFECDAGMLKGGRLLVRLAFDFDGDGVFDSYSDPQVHEVDASEGFQQIQCRWESLPGMRDLNRGKVQVELLAQNDAGPPLKVKLDPQQAHLELPFQDLIAKSSLPS